MGRRNVYKFDTDDVCRRYLAGETEQGLAKNLNVSRSVISRILFEGGVTRRTASESMYLRMSQTSPEERIRLTDAAHAAVRGVPQSEEQVAKVALTRETKHVNVSALEKQLAAMLAGIDITPQKAVGRYNVDLALTESRIAVEVFGGNWHASGDHAGRFRKRCDYLINAGWLPVIMWVSSKHPITEWAVNYIIALHQIRRSDESFGGQEHVIRGTGEVLTGASYNPNTGTTVRRYYGSYRPRGKDGRFTK